MCFQLLHHLSHVEQRQVSNGYTVQYEGRIYQIHGGDVGVGLRGSKVRVEKRLDGSIAMRSKDGYLRIEECAKPVAMNASAKKKPALVRSRKGPDAGGKSKWMNGFWNKPGPTMKAAIGIANAITNALSAGTAPSVPDLAVRLASDPTVRAAIPATSARAA